MCTSIRDVLWVGYSVHYTSIHRQQQLNCPVCKAQYSSDKFSDDQIMGVNRKSNSWIQDSTVEISLSGPKYHIVSIKCRVNELLDFWVMTI